MAINHPKAGANSIPAYQLSGVPYVTGSAANEAAGTPIRVDFPYVTRFFQVTNIDDAHALRVGFSENGVKATETKNYFVLAAGETSNVLELRTKTLYFLEDGSSSPAGFEIVAGLTTIESNEFPVLSGTIGAVTNAFEGVG
jgi:hypothetical protein